MNSPANVQQDRNSLPGGRRRRKVLAVLVLCLLPATSLAGSRGRMQPEDLRRLFEEGQYAQVQKAAEEALASAPRDAVYHYWLARSAYELGAFDTSVREAEQAVQLEPQSSEFQLVLGRAYGRKAEMESSFFLARKTRKAFEAAVKLDPGNIGARRDLSEYYAAAPWILGGSKDKARQQVEAIAAIDATEGLLALAAFYDDIEQRDNAREQFDKLVQQRPSKMQFYLEALSFYEEQRDVQRMTHTLEIARAVAPGDPRLVYFGAVAKVITGERLEQAEAELKQFLAKYPGRSDSVTRGEARAWLGALYEQQGKWKAAYEEYHQASMLEPYRKRFRKAAERAEKQARKEDGK